MKGSSDRPQYFFIKKTMIIISFLSMFLLHNNSYFNYNNKSIISNMDKKLSVILPTYNEAKDSQTMYRPFRVSSKPSGIPNIPPDRAKSNIMCWIDVQGGY